MCFRLVSTYERCGHQDNLAHVQHCNTALSATPTESCPLSSTETSDPVYGIRGFCPSCQLLHAVLGADGRLHEVSSTAGGDGWGDGDTSGGSVVFAVQGPWASRGRADVGKVKESNDVRLAWKESAAGGRGDEDVGGWSGSAAEKREWAGGVGDWDASAGAEAQGTGDAVTGEGGGVTSWVQEQGEQDAEAGSSQVESASESAASAGPSKEEISGAGLESLKNAGGANADDTELIW